MVNKRGRNAFPRPPLGRRIDGLTGDALFVHLIDPKTQRETLTYVIRLIIRHAVEG